MSDHHFQVLREIILQEAHVVAERTRDRLRDLQRRYPFPETIVAELQEAGIELSDTGSAREATPS